MKTVTEYSESIFSSLSIVVTLTIIVCCVYYV